MKHARYCTDQYLVLLGNGAANHANTLADVPRPPGNGDGTTDYADQDVTRSMIKQFMAFKVPEFWSNSESAEPRTSP